MSAPESGAYPNVAVPRWALLALLDGGRLCNVCLGNSPAWDGHDTGCQGHAQQVLRAALTSGVVASCRACGCALADCHYERAACCASCESGSTHVSEATSVSLGLPSTSSEQEAQR